MPMKIDCDLVAEQTNWDMAKSYHRFQLYGSQSSGFLIGLADFACFGWKFYDLAGYPYDDEQAALFSDWMRLGEDVETAKEKFEETVASKT